MTVLSLGAVIHLYLKLTIAAFQHAFVVPTSYSEKVLLECVGREGDRRKKSICNLNQTADLFQPNLEKSRCRRITLSSYTSEGPQGSALLRTRQS